MTPADICFWLADNVVYWTPFAIVILGGLAVAALALAASAVDTVSRHD